MADPFLGEIRLFGGNFAPRGWALCNGSLLSIAENDALFTLLGTTYGGDGQTTFGLPDFRGRLPVGQGNGPGLSPRVLGQTSGTETVTVTTQQLPSHRHGINATNNAATTDSPSNALPAVPPGGGKLYLDPNQSGVSAVDVQMPADMIALTGGSQPHENMMPFLAGSYIIALQGIFPSRN